MKKILLILSLTLVVGLTSCSNDDCNNYHPSNYELLVGRTWVGDLGVTDRVGVPLESGIYLKANGFGVDKLFYYNQQGGQSAGDLEIQWYTEANSLYLNYGNAVPPRALRDIYIRNGLLSGALYINGFYFRNVTLEMER